MTLKGNNFAAGKSGALKHWPDHSVELPGLNSPPGQRRRRRATLNNRVIAQSEDLAEHDGYSYFRRADVRMEWLEPAAKTASDLDCPHGVQFYDVVIDGMRYSRVAWSYEAPLAPLRHVAQRMGFWKDVALGQAVNEPCNLRHSKDY